MLSVPNPAMESVVLPPLVERCLAEGLPRGLRIGFPPALEARYTRETAAARRRALMVACLAGLVATLALYPALRTTLPGAERLTTEVWLGIVFPAVLFSVLALRVRLPLAFHEGAAVLASVVVASALSWLFLSTSAPLSAAYPPGLLLLFVCTTLGAQVSFVAAAICGAALLALFVPVMAHLHWHDPRVVQPVVLVTVTTFGFVLLASRRIEEERRHSFLLTLRETFRGEHLSAENLELQELARRDPLTALPNRRAFDCWMDILLRSGQPGVDRVSLISLDIDHFKSYNDHYGHPAGDRCLQAVARCLREQLRETSDMIARLGGEEFAALLPGLALDEAVEVAERLRAAVDALQLPHAGIAGKQGIVTVSAGVASVDGTGDRSPGLLMSAADSALYAAKETGRNRVCLSA